MKRRKTQSNKEDKIRKLNRVLETNPIDIDALRDACTTNGGLLTNSMRQKIWPLLINCKFEENKGYNDEEFSEPHRDWDQIMKDVERSLWRFTKENPKLRKQKRKELAQIMNVILQKNGDLHYYQGYHDVGSVFLLIFEEEKAFYLLEKLSNNQIRDCLNSSLDNVLSLLDVIFPLLQKKDQELANFLEDSGVKPYFALSWILTWYAYNFDDFNLVARFYDLFLVCHPIMPIYVAVGIIYFRREEILNSDCEFATIHGLLSKLPEDMAWEDIIQWSLNLYKKFPPNKLQKHVKADISQTFASRVTYPYQLNSQNSKIQKKNVYQVVGTAVVVGILAALWAWTLNSKQPI